MTALSAIVGIVALLLGARWFALWIARISEGVRPRPASDDELYGLAHGDWPAPPDTKVNEVFHFGTVTTQGRNDHA